VHIHAHTHTHAHTHKHAYTHAHTHMLTQTLSCLKILKACKAHTLLCFEAGSIVQEFLFTLNINVVNKLYMQRDLTSRDIKSAFFQGWGFNTKDDILVKQK